YARGEKTSVAARAGVRRVNGPHGADTLRRERPDVDARERVMTVQRHFHVLELVDSPEQRVPDEKRRDAEHAPIDGSFGFTPQRALDFIGSRAGDELLA